jgi:hypothetical protein
MRESKREKQTEIDQLLLKKMNTLLLRCFNNNDTLPYHVRSRGNSQLFNWFVDEEQQHSDFQLSLIFWREKQGRQRFLFEK